LLKAAESRIDKKVSELKALQANIEQLVKAHEEAEIAKVAKLVKIYENMKPKDAASIFEEMDMETLLLVAERMNERKLAPVMAQMSPARAKEMTVELTRAGQLPLPGGSGGG
jgi:flagellar motility protein MotE (MotC chaperone)